MAQIMVKPKNMSKIFFDFLSFCMKEPPQLRSANRVAMKQLLSKIYTDVRGCVSAKQLGISKNKKTSAPIFRFSIFFVKDPPRYLQQCGHKTALYIEMFKVL